MNNYFLGLDIGGTKTAVCVGDENGHILAQEKFYTFSDPFETIDFSLRIVNKLSQKLKLNKFKSFGISCGGPLDSRKGIILCPPNLPKWKNIDICNYIYTKINIPVYLENDANACALAEWYWGNGKGCTDIIFLTFGTGFGAGLILDGKLYRGKNSQAGEIGHIRIKEDGPLCYGKRGCIESFCSGAGIKELFYIKTKKILSTNEICELAQSGNKQAKEVIEESAKYLGFTLSMLIDLLNIEKIIIGSIFSRRENLFKKTIQNIIDKETLNLNREVCSISISGLGDNLGTMASLGVAIWGEKNDIR